MIIGSILIIPLIHRLWFTTSEQRGACNAMQCNAMQSCNDVQPTRFAALIHLSIPISETFSRAKPSVCGSANVRLTTQTPSQPVRAKQDVPLISRQVVPCVDGELVSTLNFTSSNYRLSYLQNPTREGQVVIHQVILKHHGTVH